MQHRDANIGTHVWMILVDILYKAMLKEQQSEVINEHRGELSSMKVLADKYGGLSVYSTRSITSSTLSRYPFSTFSTAHAIEPIPLHKKSQ